MKIISGIQNIIDKYDIFLLDQWGVIHDGENLLPGARHMFERLAEAQKDVVLISNSGKRSSDSHGRLRKMKIPREHYLDVITSGETVWRSLNARKDNFYQNLGKKFFMYAWDNNREIVGELDFQEVQKLDEAEFILCAGVDRLNLAAYQDDFKRGVALGLPLICANPDFVTLTPDGTKMMCPGALAQAYEDLGGLVRWHGKPQADIYETCLSIIKDSAQKKAICVGDSIKHDILGARKTGLDSLFIWSGIHHDQVEPSQAQSSILSLTEELGAVPTFSMKDFQW